MQNARKRHQVWDTAVWCKNASVADPQKNEAEKGLWRGEKPARFAAEKEGIYFLQGGRFMRDFFDRHLSRRKLNVSVERIFDCVLHIGDGLPRK